MRKMLLSLKPEIFELIRNGKKIFEYRHQFYTEPVGAYLYISRPIQKIVGYIEFDKRIELKDWKDKYKDNIEVSKRIDNFIELKEYIEKNIDFTNEVVENNFQTIHDEDICRKKY